MHCALPLRRIRRDGVTRRVTWLFADQLGQHFLDPQDDGPVILIEARSALRRRSYHRAKAHLILSALRHRARELGERAIYINADTYRSGFDEALSRLGVAPEQVTVRAPTSYAARRLVADLGVRITPARGFIADEDEFATWAAGRKRLVMEDFYRGMRRKTGVLMDDQDPIGGRWNLDADNRKPPPRKVPTLGLAKPWQPAEDDIDDDVRRDLDAWVDTGQITTVGDDGPRRFAATSDEASAVLDDFIRNRLAQFGPFEDAVMAADWVMAHSMLSAPMNMGLLDPRTAIDAVEHAYQSHQAPLASVEGFIRQVMGWREYIWHLYWHLGPDYVATSNALNARTPLPDWWQQLESQKLQAACLSHVLADVRTFGWTHHIPRLMILGNWALQQGYDPQATTEWFTRMFVDAFPWVMAANVIGMALYADGGVMATKPYAAGGAYLKRMTNFCGECRYDPTRRTGDDACPFTGGYWAFLDRNRALLRTNHRVAQPLRNLDRLGDVDEVVAQVQRRASSPP